MAGDVGLDQIEVFYRGAAAGTFRMEAGVAEACAADVQTLIDALEAKRTKARERDQLAFGAFDSAKQMQNGFESKLNDLGRFLDEFILAAEHLRESFLIAGGAVERQELENAVQLSNSAPVLGASAGR